MQATTRRAIDLTAVLARHGLGVIVDVVARRRSSARTPIVPVRLRRVLEDLGPTFMKLGQVLSTRPDLVPPSYEAELSRLQDAAPSLPASEIMHAIERSLGRRIDDAYSRFDAHPVATASIGQVHSAALTDGTEVVVKVRRPGVLEQIDVDLALLQRVARIAARRTIFERYDPVGLAREFDVTLRGELDYMREGRNAEAVAAGFADDAQVRVPHVVWSHTCGSVITEERIRGVKIDDTAGIAAAGHDRTAIARTFADAYLSMVFVHHFFHADPHPGNVFVEPDGVVAFVDFGMVGVVTREASRGLALVLRALAANDAPTMADGLLQLGIACDHVSRADLETDLSRLLDRYAYVPLERLRIGPLLSDVMAIVRAHQLRLPSDLALLIKTVMMCEGVAASLDPGFELVPLLLPYAALLSGEDETEMDYD